MSGDADQLLGRAAELHDAGRLAEAEALYRQVLAARPNDADALHYLGLLCYQLGRGQEALELVERAIAAGGQNAELTKLAEAIRGGSPTYTALAAKSRQLFEAGNLDEALAAAQGATKLDPQRPEAWSNLAIIFKAKKQPERAIMALGRAVELRPGFAQAQWDLILTLRDAGRAPEAERAGRAAIAACPDSAEVHLNFAVALKEMGKLDEALEVCVRASELGPTLAEPWNLRAILLREMRRPAEAEAAARRAVQLRADYFDGWNSLGNALADLDRLEEAIAAYRWAIALRPGDASAYANLGLALVAAGRTDEAITTYEKGIAADAEFVGTHWNLGLTRLAQGNWSEGWKLYEHRWNVPPLSHFPRDTSMPTWAGSDPRGKRIFFRAEQGFGDAIQFVRFARVLIDRGARVILECEAELRRLFQLIPGVDQVVVRTQQRPREKCDLQISLGSLPLVIGGEIPAEVPYLTADPADAARWAKRLDKNKLNVGLAWAGSPWPNPRRSMALRELTPLASARSVRFVSLQLGGAAEQLSDSPMEIADWTAELVDFAETAALVSNVDLVITIDSGVAHLAGALARPTWVMLPFAADWRWMLRRDDSPWYPTMRLFRQAAIGDWAGPVRRVAEELAKLADQSRGS